MTTYSQLRHRTGVIAFAAGVLSGASVACAGFDDPILQFEASNADGAGVFSVSLADAQFNDGETVIWNLGGTIDIMDGGATIAQITSAQLTLQTVNAQALIAVSFDVVAGAFDTQFSISSSLVDSFFFSNPSARATGTYSLTDGNLNGATLTGLHAGGGLYSADYNGGTSFTELFTSGPYNVGVSGSTGGAEDVPFGPGNFSPVGEAVSSIQGNWHFMLTAGDLAGGTSNFIVIPTPSGLALLSLGGLAAMRRRR